MEISVVKLILILVIVFALFGASKFTSAMGDLGKGIRSLKDGMRDDPKTKPREDAPAVIPSDTDKHV